MLLVYITEQIWFPHCKYRSHCPHSHSVDIHRCGIGVYMCQSTNHKQHITYTFHAIAIYVAEKIHPPHCTYRQYIEGHIWYTYATYEITGINNVTWNTVHIS